MTENKYNKFSIQMAPLLGTTLNPYASLYATNPDLGKEGMSR